MSTQIMSNKSTVGHEISFKDVHHRHDWRFNTDLEFKTIEDSAEKQGKYQHVQWQILKTGHKHFSSITKYKELTQVMCCYCL